MVCSSRSRTCFHRFIADSSQPGRVPYLSENPQLFHNCGKSGPGKREANIACDRTQLAIVISTTTCGIAHYHLTFRPVAGWFDDPPTRRYTPRLLFQKVKEN